MKNLKYFLTIFILFFFQILTAQSINWGEPVKGEKALQFKTYGSYENMVLVGGVKNDRMTRAFIFDAQRTLKERIDLTTLFDKKKELIIDMNLLEQGIVLLVLRKDKVFSKNPITYIDRVFINKNAIINREKLKELKGDYILEYKQNTRAIGTNLLDSNRKALIEFNKWGKKKIDKTAFLFLRDEAFKWVNTAKTVLFYGDKEDLIIDFDTDDEHNIYYLVKNYEFCKSSIFHNESKETCKGKPNYKVSIFKIFNEQKDSISFYTDGLYWREQAFHINDQQEILLAAYYRKEHEFQSSYKDPNRIPDGIIFLEYDQDLKLKSEVRKETDQYQERKGYPLIRLMRQLSNGKILLLTEYNDISLKSGTAYRYSVNFDTYDKEADLVKSKEFIRNAVTGTGVEAWWIEMPIIIRAASIEMYHNTSAKFLDQLKSSKSKKRNQFPSKKNMIVQSVYDWNKNELQHNQISPVGEIHIGGRSVEVTEKGQYFFMSYNYKYNNLRIGTY